jgi:CubicO group peptidase (beta-lactamase class C family)
MNMNQPTFIALCLAWAVAFAPAQDAPPPARPQYSPEQILKFWDKNGDGKLTPDEVPNASLFKLLDKNGDGVVTKDEAAAIGTWGAGKPGAKPAGQGAGAVRGSPDPAPGTTDRSPESGRPAVDGFGGVGRPAPSAVRPAPSAAKSAADWKGLGVSQGAPLPPANQFRPRPHGDEAAMAGLKPDVLAKLDVEMQRHVAAKNVAGISAIISKNGVRGYFETFGMADVEAGKPMARDAIFRLMSMTKPVIALAALTLLDEGKFTLDEPISKHCPEWRDAKVKEGGAIVPAKLAITPRMLMSHSSGLGYGGGQAAAAMAYQAMTKPGATLKEFSEAVANEPLLFQPGTSYNYGMGLDILGRYLEALTGQPLDVILKERLFGPLKMPDTDFHVPAAKVGRLCQIYGQPSPGVLVPGSDLANVTNKPTLCLGGHGLFGTIGDYERLCLMILNRGELDGVRVLKPETVDLIFENHLKHPTMKYGLGGIVNGAGSYGWGGADGTQFVVDRSKHTFTLFMVQTQHYKAPTYPAFLALANEAAGIAGGRIGTSGGGGESTGGGMSGLMKKYDKNGDGKLSRDEIPAALSDRLDVNKDGFVTEDELKALWKTKQ